MKIGVPESNGRTYYLCEHCQQPIRAAASHPKFTVYITRPAPGTSGALCPAAHAHSPETS